MTHLATRLACSVGPSVDGKVPDTAPGVDGGVQVSDDAPGNAPGVLGAESVCCCKPAGSTSGVLVGNPRYLVWQGDWSRRWTELCLAFADHGRWNQRLL